MKLADYVLPEENISMGDNPFENLTINESKLSPNKLFLSR
jgi:hypothetical protein